MGGLSLFINIVTPQGNIFGSLSPAALSRGKNRSPRRAANWLKRPDIPLGGLRSCFPSSPLPALSTSAWWSTPRRSEEHTSELQSLAYLVCRLLLEKKKRHGPPRLLPICADEDPDRR